VLATMRLVPAAPQRQALEQPLQLAPAQGHPDAAIAGLRPVEATPLQALVVDLEAGAGPLQDFHLIAPADGEAEQVRRERVGLEHIGDEQCQSIDLLAAADF
jgi:hypothetical protein